jgi:hypothetical protein
MLTSLQRAAASEVSAPKSTTKSSNNGAFEACFASGLDLSEFDSNPTLQVQAARPSASAELLRVKALEMQQKERDQREEERMQEIVKNRVIDLEKSLDKKKENKSDFGADLFVDALVSMHGNDYVVSSHKKRKLLAKKSRPSSHQQKSPKTIAVKKSRRKKY